jgi:hypothetical protein
MKGSSISPLHRWLPLIRADRLGLGGVARTRRSEVITIAARVSGLGKNSFSLAGLDQNGLIVMQIRRRCETVIASAAGLPACIVTMVSHFSAHYMGQLLVT